MSRNANVLLYLNMGGEMLYVLRQRLKAQRIAVDKSIQVLDEVSNALINPLIVSSFFYDDTDPSLSSSINLKEIRKSLERVVLSSIMRLDDSSMGKLFDLMIMMVKYQMTMVTGPREVLLVTLNHLDFVKDLLMDSSGYESLIIVHRILIEHYGNLTNEEMWQARLACLSQLESHNVRVSILLRLGLQNDDATFNPPKIRNYDEKYTERRSELAECKVNNNDEACKSVSRTVGSLELDGEHVTFLGTNIYSTSYGIDRKSQLIDRNSRERIQIPKNSGRSTAGSKAELGMLARQLGSDKDYSSLPSATKKPRPFTLELLIDGNCESDNKTNENKDEEGEEVENKSKVNDEYKAKLDHIYADLIDDENKESSQRVELLDLMDQLE